MNLSKSSSVFQEGKEIGKYHDVKLLRSKQRLALNSNSSKFSKYHVKLTKWVQIPYGENKCLFPIFLTF